MDLKRDALTVITKKWFSRATPVNAVKANYTTELLTANSNIKYESKIVGTEGNDLTVQYVQPLDADEDLNIELVGNNLIVNLETNDTPLKASTGFGNEADENEIAVEVDLAGKAGNDYTLEIVAGDSDGVELDVNEDDGVLTVTLATTDGDNAVATIGVYSDDGVPTPLIEIEVDEAGSDGNDYTVAVVAPTEGTSALNVALTGDDLVITLAVDDGDANIAGNAASLIAAAIEAIDDGGQVFNATVAEGQDDTRIIASESEKNFAGGGENFELDVAKNTVTLVAGKINSEEGGLFTATFDIGDAANVIGEDEIGVYNFTGGFDGTIVTVADDIVDAIEEDSEINEVLTATLAQELGTGLVAEIEQTNLANGRYATPCKTTNALIEISGTKYYTTKPVSKFTEDGWYSVSGTKL
jgi:hypothetical protein